MSREPLLRVAIVEPVRPGSIRRGDSSDTDHSRGGLARSWDDRCVTHFTSGRPLHRECEIGPDMGDYRGVSELQDTSPAAPGSPAGSAPAAGPDASGQPPVRARHRRRGGETRQRLGDRHDHRPGGEHRRVPADRPHEPVSEDRRVPAKHQRQRHRAERGGCGGIHTCGGGYRRHISCQLRPLGVRGRQRRPHLGSRVPDAQGVLHRPRADPPGQPHLAPAADQERARDRHPERRRPGLGTARHRQGREIHGAGRPRHHRHPVRIRDAGRVLHPGRSRGEVAGKQSAGQRAGSHAGRNSFPSAARRRKVGAWPPI